MAFGRLTEESPMQQNTIYARAGGSKKHPEHAKSAANQPSAPDIGNQARLSMMEMLSSVEQPDRQREIQLSKHMESMLQDRFGVPMKGLKVYENDDLGALDQQAYARGNEIHLAKGRYAPNSQSGQELLLHEATHVAQQGAGAAGPLGTEQPALEAEANAVASGGLYGGYGAASVPQAAPSSAPAQGKGGLFGALKKFFGKKTVPTTFEQTPTDDHAAGDRQQIAHLEQKLQYLTAQGLGQTAQYRVTQNELHRMRGEQTDWSGYDANNDKWVGASGHARRTAKTGAALAAHRAKPKPLSKAQKVIGELGSRPMGTSDPDFARYAGANSEESAAWRKGLSPEELDAVSSYSSEEYKFINNAARGLPLPDATLNDPATNQPMSKAEISKYAQMQSDRLSSALDKSRTAVPMTTHRGVGPDFLRQLLVQSGISTQKDAAGKSNTQLWRLAKDNQQKLMQGVYYDKGFTSTSLSLDTAKKFKSGAAGKQGEGLQNAHMLHYNLPKGSKAAYINDISCHDDEYEMLLDKAQKYRISGMNIADNSADIEFFLELLNEEDD
jgi:hypothetical protein